MKTVFFSLASLLAVSAHAGIIATWDYAANFNVSNNPSAKSDFSYGNGAAPGTFILDNTTILNCVGTPTACLTDGASFPNSSSIIWNGIGATNNYGTASQSANDVGFNPQLSAGSILRFTVPTTNIYSVAGAFDTVDTSHHSTNVFIYRGSTQLLSATVNAPGSVVPFSFSGLALSAGTTIDVIMTTNSDQFNLNTGLHGTITESTPSAAPEPATLALSLLVTRSMALSSPWRH